MKTSDIHIILQKLDDFIKKYYRNQFLKGLILFSVIFTIYFIAISCIEYFAFFPIYTRTLVFYLTIIVSLYAFYQFVIVPFFHMFKVGKVLTYEKAAQIIEKYFPEVQDTLRNSLELSNDTNLHDNSLAIAAINQKIKTLSPIPFSSAVDIKKLLVYWKYGVAAIAIIIIVSLFFPGAISNGATRIMYHSTYFEKPAPFTFILSNDSLQVIKGSDFTVSLSLKGKYVPNDVEIVFGGNSFFMKKKSNASFEYTFHGCNNSMQFFFKADDFSSTLYELQVNPLPQLQSFTIEAIVPTYTGLNNFSVTNTGDISIPAGTKLIWKVNATDIDKLGLFIKSNKAYVPFSNKNNEFKLEQTVRKTIQYSIIGENKFFKQSKIIDYTFTVIPDLIPSIEVFSKKDSTEFYTYYFKGILQDDYGFSGLKFVYYNVSNPKKLTKIPIKYIPGTLKQDFYFMFDFSTFEKGSKVKYYFEVFDNDMINGRKSARSSVEEFKLPTLDEIEKLQNQYSEKIENTVNKNMSLTQELLKDITSLQKKLLSENLSEWERNELMQDIQEKQQEIKNQVADMNKMLQQKNDLQQKLSEQDKEILEKQKQIEDLLKNLMDDELQKLFDDFNKLMDKFSKDEFMKKSEDMKLSLEDMSKQMDRDIELLKRMDVEQQLKSTSKKLDELSKKQEKLANDAQKGKTDSQEMLKQQEQLQNDLQKAQDSFEQTLDKNNELQEKFEMPDFKEQFNQINNSMNQSKQQIQNKQMNKSSKSMQNSSDQMEQLSESMDKMLQEQMKEKSMEDMDNLRQILDNLLTFSFQQEALISETNKLSLSDPKYPSITFKQNALRNNFDIIRDSLYSLSLRVPQLSSQINQELFVINRKLDKIIVSLEDQQRSGAMVEQQYVMTSTNNLILLLGEVLESMQKAAAEQMKGMQQCNKPGSSGKGKPSMSQISEMQQSLKQQMEQMIKQMQNGNLPGKAMQQQMSEMLMQQQMMQQMMNSLMKNGSISPEGMQQLKEIQKLMEKTEQDIVNQNVTQQTITRQQQILTRMLESEKAIKERDIDKKRESTEGKENYSKPKEMFLKENNTEIQFEDALKQTNLKFKTYYLKIFTDYIHNINQN